MLTTDQVQVAFPQTVFPFVKGQPLGGPVAEGTGDPHCPCTGKVRFEPDAGRGNGGTVEQSRPVVQCHDLQVDFLIENFVAFIAQPNVAIRTPHWKYILTDSPTGVVEELYDLDADPHELENLAFDPDHGIILATLASRLAELRER